ncbi:MAG TPA: Fur family transcriptional regulator [Acidimicrobiales bacterium]|nr:Fur family transcriptional regulator [Acidimicrobiales bacterium]
MAGTAVDITPMLEALRGSGAKITTARRAVLEEFTRTDDEHLSAEELTERVRVRCPEVHLSTVYRTLEFLEREGLITRVHLKDGPAAYHFAGNAHHHAVCDRCGREIELPAGFFRPVTRKLEADYGFVASPTHLTVTGTCASCADG